MTVKESLGGEIGKQVPVKAIYDDVAHPALSELGKALQGVCIRLFARRFQMTLQGAADYLCKFKGIRFLDDSYPSEHLLPVEDALDDLVAVCKNNGGSIG